MRPDPCSGHPVSSACPDSFLAGQGLSDFPADTSADTCPRVSADTCPPGVRDLSGHPAPAPLEVLMSQPVPSVGRTVHYVSHGTPVRSDGTQEFPPACRAAIVTEVDAADPGRVGLAVLNPSGQFFHPLSAGGSVFAECGQLGGSWHWPERVG